MAGTENAEDGIQGECKMEVSDYYYHVDLLLASHTSNFASYFLGMPSLLTCSTMKHFIIYPFSELDINTNPSF
jgi:hypothetical protein